MKSFFCLVFFFSFAVSFSTDVSDSTKTKLEANANISLNSNGIATIPAFSLDKPAVIASVELSKGRFSYDPMLGYGMERKPWFIDNWFNFTIIEKPSFELNAGINISMYFFENKLPDEEILQGQRYFALATTAIYKFSDKTSLTFSYWNDRGQDKGTIKGHFLTLIGKRSDINIGKYILLGGSMQGFYINYDGNNDGLFISPMITSSLRNTPFSVFWQATQALSSNIRPFPLFKWNIGVSYDL
jgi:hypothetical protein